jgi:hypothetical protein
MAAAAAARAVTCATCIAIAASRSNAASGFCRKWQTAPSARDFSCLVAAAASCGRGQMDVRCATCTRHRQNSERDSAGSAPASSLLLLAWKIISLSRSLSPNLCSNWNLHVKRRQSVAVSRSPHDRKARNVSAAAGCCSHSGTSASRASAAAAADWFRRSACKVGENGGNGGGRRRWSGWGIP